MLVLIATLHLVGLAEPAAQERGPTPIAPAQLQAAIDRLGDFDYTTRVKAAATVRRAPPSQAVAALLQAAREHADGYVRYRSLVLLTGFIDPRIFDQMLEAVGSPNDRLREIAYRYFARSPSAAVVPRLLAALEKETGEFVRPALLRALAAADDRRAREAVLKEATQGKAVLFRSTAIEALGDFGREEAVAVLTPIARQEGPLQDDAVLALGKIGDKRSLETLAVLQRIGPRALQPAIAASICMLGVNCSSHLGYLEKVLAFAEDNPGYQELVRSAAAGLEAAAIRGSREALRILFTAGGPSEDPIRAPLAVAVAAAALRNTHHMLDYLAALPERQEALALLAEGFDILEEDFEEEQFFVAVRRAYWTAPADSPVRALGEELIRKLNF